MIPRYQANETSPFLGGNFGVLNMIEENEKVTVKITVLKSIWEDVKRLAKLYHYTEDQVVELMATCYLDRLGGRHEIKQYLDE